MAVPNTFAAATSAIPLANLDANFAYYDAAYSITSTAISFTGAVTLSTGTANGVPYLNASKVLTSGSVLTFDGTILSSTRFAGALNGTVGATTANTGAFTTLTTSSTVTLNGGTANGVAYLNGSKVLTSGTALTYNGSDTLNLSTTNPSLRLTGDVNSYYTAIYAYAGGYGANKGYFLDSYNGMRIMSSGDIQFCPNGTTLSNGSEQMRLTSTGLGIGTSSFSGYRLNVVAAFSSGLGGAYIEAGEFNKSALILNHTNASVSANLFQVQKSGTGVMTLDSSGNLGLGVTPAGYAKLQFSSGQDIVIGQDPATDHVIANVGSIGIGVSDGSGAGVFSGVFVNNTFDGTYSSQDIRFKTAKGGVSIATERMRLDSSGNLGLGVTPSAWSLGKALEVGAAGNGLWAVAAADLYLVSNVIYSSSLFKYASSNRASYYEQNVGTHVWKISTDATPTAGNTITFTQAMTLDASGNLLVGTTVTDPVGSRVNGSVIGSGTGGYGIRTRATAGYSYIGLNSTSGTSLGFYTDNGTAFVTSGNISSNGATTLYNATSDYRLKTVLGVVTGQGARIDALEPLEYEWKADGSRARGFLAHKFQAIYANSVTETKDAVDADNNPVYQTMQASSAEVIADLVAEIQDLRKRLAAAGI